LFPPYEQFGSPVLRLNIPSNPLVNVDVADMQLTSGMWRPAPDQTIKTDSPTQAYTQEKVLLLGSPTMPLLVGRCEGQPYFGKLHRCREGTMPPLLASSIPILLNFDGNTNCNLRKAWCPMV
jgi:hypothetical protein